MLKSLVVTALAGLVWGACLCTRATAGDEQPPGQQAPAPPEIGGTAELIFPQESQYRIGVEDLLFISVWRDGDLTREVPVRPDGKISLPLIQDVQAAGRTPVELARDIEQRLKEYMKSPSVTVGVKEINSLKVYVLGEVVTPGPVLVRSKIRLLQALAMAGGLTPFGGRNGIVIYRNNQEVEKVLEVSYRDIISGKDPSANLVLVAGDTVVVR
jgi:polysaccharide export outer membrane protein